MGRRKIIEEIKCRETPRPESQMRRRGFKRGAMRGGAGVKVVVVVQVRGEGGQRTGLKAVPSMQQQKKPTKETC